MKLKTNRIIVLSKLSLVGLVFCFTSCEREVSDDAVLASFPKTAEIFTDAPIGLTDGFFESFDPATGANTSGFNTDSNTAYEGSTSIRIDVPAPNDPNGGYIGGIFRDRGEGRNLTSYDALTFWAKGSTTATFETGFGIDFLQNKYQVTTNVQLSTTWRKYVIPIPDAARLVQERGMFMFAAGTNSTNGMGYTIWLDEIRFEKLGTTALVNPFIFNGDNRTADGFVGGSQIISQIGAVYNLSSGQNISINAAPGYFNFNSTNSSVTGPFQTNAAGQVFTNVIGTSGTAVVTATLRNATAQGSLTITALGNFPGAPVPTRPSSSVISIFSDAYINVPVNYYNGYWQPWQTTVSEDFSVNGDNILNYKNYNFVGIEFSSPTVNATSMTHFHANFYIPGPIAPGRQLRVIIVDFGANGVFGGGDDTRHSTTFVAPTLVSQNWITITIPFSAMPNLASRSNLGQIIFEGGDNSILWVDNIYFYNNN
ncbi:glycosyl hydrolase family 16 [Flavobacterium sp. j3]|uniref:Glycosyl hydrolase family 16 n=1 Tax=Flavobacterium aureirubrum TaxID=3133147 RepID=A0ABU9N4S9_9FLAO